MSRNDDREQQMALFVEQERDAFAAAFEAVCRRGVDPEICQRCSDACEMACECGGVL